MEQANTTLFNGFLPKTIPPYEHLFVIGRHGIRFPLKRLPGDLAWPEEDDFVRQYGGLLTQQGFLQVQANGAWIRKMFFDGVVNKPAIRVLTTHTKRTLQSATAFLSGFVSSPIFSYRFEGSHRPPPLGENIPITIVRKFKSDYCSRILHDYKHSPYVRERSEAVYKKYAIFVSLRDGQHEVLADKLYRMTELGGFHAASSVRHEVEALQIVRSQIAIERALGMPILANKNKEELTTSEIEVIYDKSDVAVRLRLIGLNKNEHKQLSAIAVDTLPHLISDDLDRKLESVRGIESSPNSRSITVYSGHDSTLNSMISFLGGKRWHIPEFAAMLIFQLTNDRVISANEPVVKIYYMAKDSSNYECPGNVIIIHPGIPYSLFSRKMRYCVFCKRESHMIARRNNNKPMEEISGNCDFCDVIESIRNPFNPSLQISTSASVYNKIDRLCNVCSKSCNLICSRCQCIYYCSEGHQSLDWTQHRLRCREDRVVSCIGNI
jgi:hypothetical protein